MCGRSVLEGITVIQMNRKYSYSYRSQPWVTAKFGAGKWYEIKGVLNGRGNFGITKTAARLVSTFVQKESAPSGGGYRSVPTLESEGAVSAWTKSATGFWPFLSYPSARIGITLTQRIRIGSSLRAVKRHESIVEINEDNWETETGYLGDPKFPEFKFYIHDPSKRISATLEARLTYFTRGNVSLILGVRNTPFKLRIPSYKIVKM
jgi:hypothetical protein